MPIDVAHIQIGNCYRTGTGQLRRVTAVEEGQVAFVVIFHAFNRTSVGPTERMPIDQFAAQAQTVEPSA